MLMPGQGLVIFFSASVLLIILVLVHGRQITERLSILWLLISTAMLVTATIGFRFLLSLADLVGIAYGPSLLFLLAFIGLLLLNIYFTILFSRLTERNKTLSQHVAILETELSNLRKNLAKEADPNDRE